METSLHQQNSATIDILRFLGPLAQESKKCVMHFFRNTPWSVEKSSPLLVHWAYLIAVTFMRIKIGLNKFEKHSSSYCDISEQQAVELAMEAEQGLSAMRWKLSLLSKQWVSADTHLRILEAREHAGML